MNGVKYVIGITGNLGSGKSTVLHMLEKLGAKAIDADNLTHEVMAPGTPVWRAVGEAFGPDIIKGEEIDRERLAAIVFSDEEALRRLEAIVHPAVEEAIWQMVAEAAEKVVAIEAIRLVERGANKLCHELWVVTCSPEKQRERLLAQGRYSEEEIEQRLKAQGPEADKVELADVIIDNSGSEEETWKQVKREWRRVQRRLP
jgi:dephospho-CoA kinase